MLSTEQYKIIEEQLSKENAAEFVRVLIGRYSNTIENIEELLNYIPKLAVRQLEVKQKRLNQYSWGMDLLIGDRYNHHRKYKKEDSHGRFMTLLYSCKAHFTNGNAENGSVAGKAFFNEFIEMLQEKMNLTIRIVKTGSGYIPLPAALTGWKAWLNRILTVNL